MKVSARMDYAVRALLELGLHWPDTQPLQLEGISRRAGVPQKFLIHILIDLKNLGAVNSIRGKKGGYVLGEDPRKINLAAIVRRLGGIGSFEEEKRKKKNDSVSLLWKEIDKSIIEKLEKISLEDLCNRQRQAVKTLSFDI
ncbi:MAG: Rrf2 family transcriptional regulator [Candidatus Omnitrophica bacterium]|nr:Rrf2 family transcriptional regulator [Candidatus Omnitrophota bacterium]MDE2009625.1 Rrf2 family transcriptional regulator [Candidatus Omnitrophota bacterium]MDE2214447.1 Rrf2 family transcriptional regulator [Candidatus Omnitrophota bacterium]MDE2231587.1 Rrf2 family transcriptional regulator [Candidatus Omnitrophota bacterium]